MKCNKKRWRWERAFPKWRQAFQQDIDPSHTKNKIRKKPFAENHNKIFDGLKNSPLSNPI